MAPMSKAFDFIRSNAAGSIFSTGDDTNQHPTTNPVPPTKVTTLMSASLNFLRAQEGDTAVNRDAQQKLLYIARLLDSQKDFRPPRELQVSLAKLDSALSGMEFAERVYIKQQFSKSGIING